MARYLCDAPGKAIRKPLNLRFYRCIFEKLNITVFNWRTAKLRFPEVLRFVFRFIIAMVALTSIGSIANAESALIDEDAILRLANTYPQMDEYPYIPEYCVVKLEEIRLSHEVKGLPPNLARARQAYVEKLGDGTWTWLHHYCAAINEIRRFEKSVRSGIGGKGNLTKLQKDILFMAIGHLNMIEGPYLQYHSPLYAGTIANYAKVFFLLGRYPEVISKMKDGIANEPANDALYLDYGRFLIDMGLKEDAKKVLESGYKRTNKSKRIEEMLSSLKLGQTEAKEKTAVTSGSELPH
jgi:hypothetical protein